MQQTSEQSKQTEQDMGVSNGSLVSYQSLTNIPTLITDFVRRVLAVANKQWLYFTEQVNKLTLSQICYVIAIVLLFTIVEGDFDESENTVWVGLFAGLGLMRELWTLFHKVWQKTLGKGVLLVLYAATANFAVAIAALKINDIAGVEPTPFIFTLGFTTLTMLPFWLIMASVLFFAIALVVQTMWLILGLALRLVRFKIRLHWEDEAFAVVTIILRLILTPVLIVSLIQFATPYFEQLNFVNGSGPLNFNISDPDPVEVNVPEVPEDKIEALVNGEEGALKDIIEHAQAQREAREEAGLPILFANGVNAEQSGIENAGNTEESPMDEVERQRDLDRLISVLPYFERLSFINMPLNFSVSGPENVDELMPAEEAQLREVLGQTNPEQQSIGVDEMVAQTESQASDGATNSEEGDGNTLTVEVDPNAERNRDLDRMIAAFIYRFETYPKSMCKKEPHQHSLVIDENSVLLVEKSDNELGYIFSVKACEYVYEE
ncbi:hypothetical protein EYS14_20690 [Alteromonadaceae bacterium M269]|nr:hypothetical protein EYS14_20690 [Alteromonadaceae bacterium M269]